LVDDFFSYHKDFTNTQKNILSYLDHDNNSVLYILPIGMQNLNSVIVFRAYQEHVISTNDEILLKKIATIAGKLI
jgi:hypothetical protein